jgi:hypothetical protein
MMALASRAGRSPASGVRAPARPRRRSTRRHGFRSRMPRGGKASRAASVVMRPSQARPWLCLPVQAGCPDCALSARMGGDALHEIKDAFRRMRPSSASTVSMILPVSALPNPRLRRKVSRSSSVRATTFSRAALMPATNGAGEELAKLVSAGAASWAKRCAANLRVPDSDFLEIFHAPQVAVHAHRAQIE